MWRELLDLYQDTDALLPLLKPRSQAALEIRAADRLTRPSDMQRRREEELRVRSP